VLSASLRARFRLPPRQACGAAEQAEHAGETPNHNGEEKCKTLLHSVNGFSKTATDCEKNSKLQWGSDESDVR